MRASGASVVTVAALAAAFACHSPLASFECASSEDCGAGGACEPAGRCSFADEGCASGRRYGELAGPLAERCVERAEALGIALGAAHSCALLADGAVHCWGDDAHGQLGDGAGGPGSSATPRPVRTGDGPLQVGDPEQARLVAGADHSCVLEPGRAWCWGRNHRGQIDPGQPRLLHEAVGFATAAVDLGLGAAHTCAADAATVRCWGANDEGQLGGGSVTRESLPPVEVVLPAPPTRVAAGGGASCAVAGGLFCWGDDGSGQLGVGSPGDVHPSPQPVALEEVAEIALGEAHACARQRDGRLSCWGAGATGALGLGDTADRSTPAALDDLPAAVAISVGAGHSCAVVDAEVLCWGTSRRGETGQPVGTISTSAEPVVGVDGARAIAAGAGHSCAIDAGGGVACWGSGERGQIGAELEASPGPVRLVFPR